MPYIDENNQFWDKYFSSYISSFKTFKHTIIRVLALLLVVSTALMIWKTFVYTSGSEAPVVVVLSGSMEPTFYKGDILTLSKPSCPYDIGDIVVFKIPGRDIPIVHRIMEIHTDSYGVQQQILTKGDNNDSFDRPLYSGQQWIHPQQILGKASLILPYLGYLTISLSEYPIVKYALLALMGFFVLTAKD